MSQVNYNVGDLIRMTRGEEVIQGRVLADDAIKANDVFATLRAEDSLTPDDLLDLGFELEVLEKAGPQLPTEPGVYTDHDGDFWALNVHDGRWRFLSMAETGAHLALDRPQAHLPFTRVSP